MTPVSSPIVLGTVYFYVLPHNSTGEIMPTISKLRCLGWALISDTLPQNRNAVERVSEYKMRHILVFNYIQLRAADDG